MPEKPDLPAVIASLIVLGILGGSLLLWVRRLNSGNPREGHPTEAPAWPIGWVNFGLFICALLIAIFVGQTVGYAILRPLIDKSGGEITPWIAVGAILSLHLPMLAVFFALRQLYPGLFGGPLNSRWDDTLNLIRQAAAAFVQYWPVLVVVGFLWSSLLSALQQADLVDQIKPQELVLLFSEGGDPLTLAILAVFAIVLAPLSEELIFRGGVYRFLKSKTPILFAQGASGAFFALLHGNLLSFLPLTVLGALLARVYEEKGHIFAPICFHAIFNSFTLLMLFLASQSDFLGM